MFHTVSKVHHVLLCCPYLVAKVNGKMMLMKMHRPYWIVYVYNVIKTCPVYTYIALFSLNNSHKILNSSYA